MPLRATGLPFTKTLKDPSNRIPPAKSRFALAIPGILSDRSSLYTGLSGLPVVVICILTSIILRSILFSFIGLNFFLCTWFCCNFLRHVYLHLSVKVYYRTTDIYISSYEKVVVSRYISGETTSDRLVAVSAYDLLAVTGYLHLSITRYIYLSIAVSDIDYHASVLGYINI